MFHSMMIIKLSIEVLHLFSDQAPDYLEGLRSASVPIALRTVTQVPPLSFGMYATQIKEALLVEDPRETLERLYRHWWTKIEGDVLGAEPTAPA